jgi:D-serine deaminase-like pyridoxal phosphate-dependent protein
MDRFQHITSPTLFLDEQICKNNIKNLVQKAQKHNLGFRPHLKTPQSQEVASWLRAYGVDKVTVSSLQMAAYFAADGWQDITVAFPLNIRALPVINQFKASIKLNLLIENTEGLEALEQSLTRAVDIWIKINIGNDRTGLSPDHMDRIAALHAKARKASKVRLIGFLGHAGQSYAARHYEGIAEAHRYSLSIMARLKSAFPDMQVSVGDTPTVSVMDDFPNIDEIRPGNFFFYDLMQLGISSCSEKDIAVAMACPVVSKHPSRGELVVYGGAIHFSKDHLLMDDGTPYYGLVVHRGHSSWEIAHPKAYIKALSQEHGIVKAPAALMQRVAIGDIIECFPVHSCLTANLMKQYSTIDGRQISMMPTLYKT